MMKCIKSFHVAMIVAVNGEILNHYYKFTIILSRGGKCDLPQDKILHIRKVSQKIDSCNDASWEESTLPLSFLLFVLEIQYVCLPTG